MSTISQYTFNKSFNVEYLTKRQALEYGISSFQFSAADKNNTSELTVDEISNNDEICDALLKQMASASKTVKTDETKQPVAIAEQQNTTINTETTKSENLSYEA